MANPSIKIDPIDVSDMTKTVQVDVKVTGVRLLRLKMWIIIICIKTISALGGQVEITTETK